MTKIKTFSKSLTAIFGALLLQAAPAQAVNFLSFVASTGIDSNSCTRAAPCQSLPRAVSQTLAGGTVGCTDSGPFFLPTQITQSITIDCLGGTLMAGGSTMINVNGSGIVVTLRNFSINGLGTGPSGGGSTGQEGIHFTNGSVLNVENVQIYGTNTIPAVGIKFAPTAPGSHLIVTDALITNNGSGSVGGGIVISPQSGGTAQVSLNRVTVSKNVFGIAADGTGSTGGINMTISDSVIGGNSQDGIIAVTQSGAAPIGVMVKNTKSVNNSIGIRSIGPNVTARVDGSTVTGNGTGLSALSGGALLTAGNNMVRANGADGAFSGLVALE